MYNSLLDLAIALFTVALVACAASAAPAATTPGVGAGDSGIEGTIVIRPLSPVVRTGQSNERPYQAKVTVLDANGQLVTQVESDAAGKFRVSLNKPGRYMLQPESSTSRPRAPKQWVTVVAGQFAQVTVAYDTGIR